jgi:threonine/homoserine/homoserine lactone efflux protein
LEFNWDRCETMPLPFLLKGFALGFAIAAPVGPIGILCIRRSLSDGARAGLATGLGAATADAAYGAVAAFGLTAVSGFLVDERTWLRLGGGLFLAYLGVTTWRKQPADSAAGAAAASLVAAYVSTFFLTLANPATILSFVAVFAGFGLASAPGYPSAALLAAGVFLGSGSWWLILSQGVGFLRSRVTPGWMKGINRLSGFILIAFAALALASVHRP